MSLYIADGVAENARAYSLTEIYFAIGENTLDGWQSRKKGIYGGMGNRWIQWEWSSKVGVNKK